MELRLHHIIDHLCNMFLENDGSENCAQLLEEEVNKMFGTKYLNDEHDCNVVSVNSLNIHDANDMQGLSTQACETFGVLEVLTPEEGALQQYSDEGSSTISILSSLQ